VLFPARSSYAVPSLESYKNPVVATLKSKQPPFSPLAISVSLFFPSVLALALVVSLALVAVVYGLYIVVTVVQVASIVTYVVISYLVALFTIALVLVLVSISSYAIVTITLSIIDTVSLITNVLATVLVATLFDIFDMSPEVPVLVVKAFPSSQPSLPRAA
jgi:hypothetical protein